FGGANPCPDTRLQSGEKWEPSGIKVNKRSVWTVTTQPYKGAHFAVFPPSLIEPCILAGCPYDGTVLDPFGGSGTTGMVSERLGRNSILIELNPEYINIQKERTSQRGFSFGNNEEMLN
ncbi:MAG: site-specific DNA-methyltransferase, partial [Nanoarchaeota archaeon]|nr:site-specific DNA-methyltransferase [Nanoarchaeota archaeon]